MSESRITNAMFRALRVMEYTALRAGGYQVAEISEMPDWHTYYPLVYGRVRLMRGKWRYQAFYRRRDTWSFQTFGSRQRAAYGLLRLMKGLP